MKVIELRHKADQYSYYSEKLVIYKDNNIEEVKACVDIVFHGNNRDIILYEEKEKEDVYVYREFVAVRIRDYMLVVTRQLSSIGPRSSWRCYTIVAIDENKVKRILRVSKENYKEYSEVIYDSETS